MRKRARGLFYISSAVLWLFVLGLVAEVYLRNRVIRADNYVSVAESVKLAHWESARIRANTAPAVQPPAKPPPRPASEGAFFALSDGAREELARERDELILLCDEQGAVHKHYGGHKPSSLRALAQALAVGTSFSEALSPQASGDVLQLLRLAIEGGAGWHVRREYPIALPGGAEYVFDFAILQVTQGEQGDRLIPVFVRPSIWDVLWHRFRPNHYVDQWDDLWPDTEFWTNNLGWRDEYVAVPKPEKCYRIACIGGSTTVAGPRNDLTYPHMLQEMLREHFETDRIEVVNCGVYSVGSGREALLAEDYLAIEPDLVIHYNFVNDLIFHLPQWTAPNAFFAAPLDTMKGWLRNLYVFSSPFNRALLPGGEKLEGLLETHVFETMRETFAKLRAGGADVAVCSFDYPDVTHMETADKMYYARSSVYLSACHVSLDTYGYLVSLYNKGVQSLCQKEGFIYVPVEERVQGGLNYYIDFHHMHLAGMREKAAAVFEGIRPHVTDQFTPVSEEPAMPRAAESMEER